MAWRPLGGTTRKYENTETGAVISRRQYLKQQRGGLTNEQYRDQQIIARRAENAARRREGKPALPVEPMRQYRTRVRKEAAATGKSLGEIRASPDFAARYREETKLWNEVRRLQVYARSTYSKAVYPNGPANWEDDAKLRRLNVIMEDLGLRDGGEPYAPGFSPSAKGKAA